MLTITQLRSAADGAAWKTATMRGYLFKTVLEAATYGDGAFSLTFREAANDTSGGSPGTPVDHVFYFNVDSTKSTTAASVVQGEVTLDFELLGHVLTAMWTQGSAEDFEIVRDGTGTW